MGEEMKVTTENEEVIEVCDAEPKKKSFKKIGLCLGGLAIAGGAIIALMAAGTKKKYDMIDDLGGYEIDDPEDFDEVGKDCGILESEKK